MARCRQSGKRLRVLVHDFAGHPFPVQLSRELARRGNAVVHAHCPSYASGKGALERVSSDPTGFEAVPLRLRRYDKHSLVRRVPQEIAYGRLLGKLIARVGPDVVISGNTPLIAQAMAQTASARAGAAFVFWQQDILSLAIARLIGRKVPGLSTIGAYPFRLIETRTARASDAVVPISPDFVPWLSTAGVDVRKIRVVENWAPLSDLPLADRDNPWAREHGLVGKPVVLYSGTLGKKHGSHRLADVARELDREGVTLVVVSEGTAADDLRRWAAAAKADRLLVLPFQPYGRLADVLGSADVLLAVLDERAGELSVPSKVLTYLCAGRPIVAAIPGRNRAAQTIREAEAGVVTSQEDVETIASHILRLLTDTEASARLGSNARAYAEDRFRISAIAPEFEGVFRAALEHSRARVTRRSLRLSSTSPAE
jgi:colanic acid biosynthesis glycosyl transferase WcaI